ncbi:MAG: universal stress protein [Acidimicrobiia bacterium]
MGRAIIVGVDQSETAAKAAAAAANLAESMGSPLHVVTAYEDEESVQIEVGSDRFFLSSGDSAENLARSIASSLARPGLTVTSSAAPGKPHDVLIEEAERLDAAIIVVGNRRMQGAGRLLGSIANSVAHHAPCDVYIVKTT